MSTLITVLHVIVCLFLMLTVLLQSGKGGGMGSAFGGGNASTMFGGSGASSFLRRLTAIAGTIFMLTSMVLAFIASHNAADSLESFGEKEQQRADENERLKQQTLGTGSGSGAITIPGLGSGSIKLPPGLGSNIKIVPPAGSTTPPATTPPATTPPATTPPATTPPATTPPATTPPATTPPATTPPAAPPAAKSATPADGSAERAKPPQSP